MLKIWLILTLVYSALALDCNQIIDSVIYDGSTVWLPNGLPSLQVIPANWNCTYKITAPTNSTNGLYARVTLSNALKGLNDYIAVNGIDGVYSTLNSRSNPVFFFDVIPGSQMFIHVVTKSVFMNSAFSITVEYHAAKIGSTVAMKTGGEMNYLDAVTMKDSSSAVSTLTYSGSEPLAITLATMINSPQDFANIYFIDGTITNQTKIYDMRRVGAYATVTRTNFLTIVKMDEKPAQFVLNTAVEVEQFHSLQSATVTSDTVAHGLNGVNHFQVFREALEFVNFDSTGIIMDDMDVKSALCQAYVVSGPPNNSSQILLDLSTNPKMPYTFNVKYFTVYEDDCIFSFSIRSS